MNFWIKPIKVVVELKEEIFYPAQKCPSDAVQIDFLAAEPNINRTHTQTLVVDLKEVNILFLNAWDAATVITVIANCGLLKNSKRFYKMFYGNPDEGLRTVVRTALDLPAVGEGSYHKNHQFRTRAADWNELRAAALIDARRIADAKPRT